MKIVMQGSVGYKSPPPSIEVDDAWFAQQINVLSIPEPKILYVGSNVFNAFKAELEKLRRTSE